MIQEYGDRNWWARPQSASTARVAVHHNTNWPIPTHSFLPQCNNPSKSKYLNREKFAQEQEPSVHERSQKQSVYKASQAEKYFYVSGLVKSYTWLSATSPDSFFPFWDPLGENLSETSSSSFLFASEERLFGKILSKFEAASPVLGEKPSCVALIYIPQLRLGHYARATRSGFYAR